MDKPPLSEREWHEQNVATLRERFQQLAFDGREALRALTEAERELRKVVARERGPSEF